jgi:hypothetical protein
MTPTANTDIARLEAENAKLRAALTRLDEILNDNEISDIPYATMELHGDIVEIVNGQQHILYMLGNSDLRQRGNKPYVFNENAEAKFDEAVSHFFNDTIAVALKRSRISEIETIVSSALRDLGSATNDEERTAPAVDLTAGTLEDQIIAHLSLSEDSERNASQLYQQTRAESLSDLEELLSDLVERKKITRFYRVRTPFDHNDGIADYATLEEIPDEFEDDWREPPTSFTREEAIIDVRYKLAR